MSFLKFAVFRISRIVGSIITLFGVVFIFTSISSHQEDKIILAVGIVVFGIVLRWFGGYRADTTTIERGIKDSKNKEEIKE